jgi:PAS domain S-box-containing protein
MKPSRSSIHETPTQTDEGIEPWPASTQIPDDPQASEFYLSKVMDTIPAMVWSARPNGVVEFCNQRWLDYTGMTLNELRAAPDWAAPIHPEDRPALMDKWRAALTQGSSLEAEARVRRVDGSFRCFLIQAVPLRESDGRIVRWYGTNTDIEELKRAREEVLTQTSLLDELFKQAPDALAVLSTDDRIVRVNQEFTRLFGYEPHEVLQHPVNDLIVPEKEIERSREYTLQLKQGRRVAVETVRKRKDGTEVYVSLLAVPVTTTSGEQIVNYAIYRDITEQKRAKEQLRESEARFQVMADKAPVLIWMTGTDGLCNYFNKPWLDFTGRTMEQEVGTGWTEGVHPDDVQGCFDCFLPAFNARKPFRMEYRLRRADGEYRWVIESGIPRYTGGGEFAGYIGSNIDITDRKRAESLLAGEKLVLEMLAKGDSLAEILHSLCRLVEEQANGVLASILLLDGDRLRHGGAPSLPKAYTNAIDGAVIGPSAGSCGTAAYRGEQVIVEDIATDPLWAAYRDLALPHSLRSCWSTPVFSSQGKVIATCGMYYREPRRPSARDQEMIEQISHLAGVAIERKLAQEALRRSEAYLAEAQRLTHTGSWAEDASAYKVLYWSEETFRILGLDPQQGIPDSEYTAGIIHPEDRDRVDQLRKKAMREKVDFAADYRIVFPDGTLKHLHLIGHPVFDEAGEVHEYVGTVVDITERKRAEDERERLRQLQSDLARINRVTTMGELTASVAHEIKQPISAAVMDAGTCVEWLARDRPDVEEARHAASRIVQDVTRASQIIDRIRLLFKKGEPQRELIDVNQVIREMIVLLRGEARLYSIAIHTELAADLPIINADRVQLQQVFMNLMLNAIDAIKDMKGAGELTIRSQPNPGGQLLISVSDSGAGLPSDQANKIFDAFFTTKPDGTGMGLSISRSIIESHGGRLWASANSGRGATFQFTLPIDIKAAA